MATATEQELKQYGEGGVRVNSGVNEMIDPEGEWVTMNSQSQPRGYEQNLVSPEILSNSQSAITLPELKQTTYPTITAPVDTTEKEDPLMEVYKNYFDTAKENAPDANATENLYNQVYEGSGIDTRQQEVNNAMALRNQEQANLSAINAQIKAIVDQGTQAQLQLEQNAQGKDITTAFLGKQQQEISRQSAIKALPLQSLALASQAKIQSLQGNVDASQTLLDQAKEKMNTLFSIHLQDAENTRSYKKELGDKLLAFMTTAEQRQYDKKTKAEDRKFDVMKTNMETAKDLSMTALESGQASLAGQIMRLDPNDPSYMTKLGELQAQIREGNSLDDQLKKMQIAKIQQDMNNNGSTETAENLFAYAQQYASTGTIPVGLPKGTLGIVSQVASDLSKQNGTIVDNNTNIKSSKLSPTQLDAYGALKDLIVKLDDANSAFSAMGSGVIAGALGWIKPGVARQQYTNVRNEIVDLLVRARSGAAITANEERMYLAKLPSNWTQPFGLGMSGEGKIDSLKSSIESVLDNKLKANGVSMYGFSKVKLGEKEYNVGDIIDINGLQGRVNPDGSITLIN